MAARLRPRPRGRRRGLSRAHRRRDRGCRHRATGTGEGGGPGPPRPRHPRYRDRTPGEFVFGEHGPFRQRGHTLVRTPRGMREPYYARLGFTPEGDHYVLRTDPGEEVHQR
ncbi:hypothetical protein LP422_07630 [Janibacter limosus]|uniref:Uncharacterized protein n=1 Tax=Janibacter limosus TaxID=53458 RepID=A0AC61U7D7_9MICO|nr:hypothetical protein [Janibacter limosus]UUZ45798.1 hypothetical protein LP422_07630 [Janibacter limosus]